MVQIVLNFTDYPLQDLVKFLDLLELMVLENQLHWEYYLEIWNLIWEILKNHQSGRKYWSFLEEVSCKIFFLKCSKKTWRLLLKSSM